MMKSTILVLAFYFFLCFQGLTQNAIVAGQTGSTNIHYTEYIPDSSIYLGQNIDGFKIDLDHNGSYDLLFSMDVKNWLPMELITWSTVQLLNSNTSISLLNDTSNWIHQLESGDTISENQIWSNSIDSLFYFQMYVHNSMPAMPMDTTYGEFNNGYLGFKMIYPNETFYGWIKVVATEFTLSVNESAVRGLTVGQPEFVNPPEPIAIYPNPCNNEIKLNYTSLNNKDLEFKIFTITGKRVSSGEITDNVHIIDVSDLSPGFYVLTLMENDRIINALKFSKMAQ
jgi:hypothetical protein